MFSSHLRRRQLLLRSSVLVLALAAGACSNSSEAEDAAQAVEAESSETTLVESEAAEPEPGEVVEDPTAVDVVTFAAHSDEGRLRYRGSSMGGVSFEVAEGDPLFLSGDSVVVSDRPIDEFGPTAAVGLISQLMSGDSVAAPEDFIAAIESVTGATIEPTGTAIDLLGYRLIGYRTEAPLAAADTLLFADQRLGSEPQSGASPFPFGITFVAETPAGLLTAGMTFFDADQAETLEPTFGTLLESITFTGPGLDGPLMVDPAAVEEPAGEPAPPANVVEGGPPLLGAPFSPVEPGSYLIDNFGRALVLDLGENWFVFPNFPGIVAIGAPGSIGPGDRDLVMINGVVDAVPTAGPLIAGEPVPLDDIDAFLTSPPSAVSVSGIERFVIDGSDIIQFDLLPNPDADCSMDDPCDLTFRTDYGADTATQSTQFHRVWWFEEHPNGPAMIIATDAVSGTFVEQATAVVRTAQLLD